jgi:hypothetical protein
MKKRVVLLMLALGFLAGGLSDARAATIDFALIPADGIVSGPAGSTLGWGYAITNNDPDHDLLIWGIDTSVFADGVPDTAIFDFPYIAAGTSVSVPYVPGVGGLFELAWNAGLPAGTTESGYVTLFGDLLDPADFSAFGPVELSAPYTATVSRAVPEPGTVILLAGGLLGLATLRKRR